MVLLLSQNARDSAGRIAALMMLAAAWQTSSPLREGQALLDPSGQNELAPLDDFGRQNLAA